MKILGSIWFTSIQNIPTIGIVLMNNDYEDKAYIGIGHGMDQKADEISITKYGGKFPVDIAKKLMGVE